MEDKTEEKELSRDMQSFSQLELTFVADGKLVAGGPVPYGKGIGDSGRYRRSPSGQDRPQ